MPVIKFDYRSIVSASPEVDSCPAYLETAKGEIRQDNKQIALFNGERWYNGRAIAGAVGPIICELCDIKCTNAYILLDEDGVEVLRSETNIPISETPISIRLVDEETYGSPDSSTQVDTLSPDEARLANYGSRSRLYNALINTAIDLHRAGVLTAGPDGEISAHQVSFQPELGFGQSNAEACMPEQGQLSLF